MSLRPNMESELIECKLCGSMVHHEFSLKEMHDFDVTFVVCEDCGLNFMNPMFTKQAYIQYYDGIYERFHGVMQTEEIKQGCKGDTVGIFLKDKLPEARKIYEVGCGAGGNLSALKSYHDFKVGGLDPSTQAKEIAKDKFGLEIDLSDCGSVTSEELNGVDVICMLDVIEHLVDPVSSLRHLYSQMETGSHIYIETLALEVDYPPKGLKGYLNSP